MRDGRVSRRAEGSGVLESVRCARAERVRRRPTIRAVAVYADLLRYRELFASLFQRDLRAKYKGSVLGLAWTLALP